MSFADKIKRERKPSDKERRKRENALLLSWLFAFLRGFFGTLLIGGIILLVILLFA